MIQDAGVKKIGHRKDMRIWPLRRASMDIPGNVIDANDLKDHPADDKKTRDHHHESKAIARKENRRLDHLLGLLNLDRMSDSSEFRQIFFEVRRTYPTFSEVVAVSIHHQELIDL